VLPNAPETGELPPILGLVSDLSPVAYCLRFCLRFRRLFTGFKSGFQNSKEPPFAVISRCAKALWHYVMVSVRKERENETKRLFTFCFVLFLPVTNSFIYLSKLFHVYYCSPYDGTTTTLQMRTVDAILCVRFGLKWKKVSCFDFEATENMLGRFRLDMYDRTTEQDGEVILDEDYDERDKIENACMILVEEAFYEAREDELFQCISL
jgi:hypothetical protein